MRAPHLLAVAVMCGCSSNTSVSDGGAGNADSGMPAIVAHIDVGAAPHGLAVATDHSFVMATEFNDEAVAFIDPVAQKVTQSVSLRLRGPVGVALTKDKKRAFVSSELAGTVTQIDVMSRTAKDAVSKLERPHGLALSPDEGTLYVCNLGANYVAIIDTTTMTKTGQITVGDSPDSVVVSADGKRLFVTNYAGTSLKSTVSIVDAQTKTELKAIEVGKKPHGIALAPDGKRLYASLEGESEVVVIDPEAQTIIARYKTGKAPHALGVHPSGRSLWTGNLDDHTITTLDATTGALTATIALDGAAEPHVIAFSPDGSRAYVSNFFAREVLVFSVP